MKDENAREKVNFFLPLTVFTLCVLIFIASFFLKPLILLDTSEQSVILADFFSELKKGNTDNLSQHLIADEEFKGFNFDDRLLNLLLKKNIENIKFEEKYAFRTKDGSGVVINISAEYLDVKKIVRDSVDELGEFIKSKLKSETGSAELFDQSGSYNETYIKTQLSNIILNKLEASDYLTENMVGILFEKDGDEWKIVLNKELSNLIFGLN
ncbi:MAG: hypothetical protein GYA88_01420 [Clostridiales bacterium]|nr:hypothetical protein [Clostridiales bacterium]